MTRRSTYSAVKISGGLLPEALLERVGTQDPDLEGIGPTDYHLASGERLGEAMTRSWNRLLAVWERFTQRLDDEGALTGPTRQEWLIPLFQELEYGQLQTLPGIEIEGKSYPVSHQWESVPVHLVGAGTELGVRSPGVPGAARVSPHGLMQELLNRSSEFQWGIVSNGRRLRLLRDNASLTRDAYVEFDLEGMFAGNSYSDFVALWLTCHSSRLEGTAGKQLIERWREDALRQGVRALDELRQGVETAIRTLGAAAVRHPNNRSLRAKLEAGELDAQEFYRQLLRVVYRLLFLLVTESRGLLPDPEADPTARQRYERYYSIARLRELAEEARGTNHTDLWRQLHVVSSAFESQGEPALALHPLGGFLWASESTSALNDLDIPNSAVLDAIRALTSVRLRGGVTQRVDYANLGAEELGSVYEGLLEYGPRVNPVAATFELVGVAGNERKTTGSYYTPTSLIDQLLNTALDPVVEEAADSADPEQTILNLKVVDPAAGSGHFLIAAAHRIADRLARIRTDGNEPSPEQRQEAVRDVIGRCIHAVDMNPMAVELAKVAMWIEAMQADRPLTFLDHHIVCGNSLLGTTPALVEQGIPDQAFKALTGDDKSVVASLKKRNRAEGKKKLRDHGHGSAEAESGVTPLWFGDSPQDLLDKAAASYGAIDELPDESVEHIAEKQRLYKDFLESDDHQRLRLAADAWVAAFVGPKTVDSPAITTALVRTALAEPEAILPDLATAIHQLATRLRFHHWHLAFPSVFTEHRGSAHEVAGWSGGFDVVLGNPPWERVKLHEKEFFANTAPEIAAAPNKAARSRLIDALEVDNPPLWQSFQDALHDAEATSHFLRSSGMYPLCGRGDVNTYTVFAEGMRTIISPTGRVGVIVPTGIATDDTTKHFFSDLVDRGSIVSLFDFENRKAIFPGVHRSYKFCLLTLTGIARPIEEAEFSFFALETADLADPECRFTLTAEDFALLNPESHTCPVFRSRRDAEINRSVYRRHRILGDYRSSTSDQQSLAIQRLFDMTNDASLFKTGDELIAAGLVRRGSAFHNSSAWWLPTYEGKMITSFDHRDASIVVVPENAVRQQQSVPSAVGLKEDPHFSVTPALWGPAQEVAERAEVDDPTRAWYVGAKRVTASTNWRTLVACVVPPCALSYTLYRFTTGSPHDDCWLLAAIQSFAFDYLVRQKTSQTSLPIGVIRETAFPSQDVACPGFAKDAVVARVLELSYTAWDLEALAIDLGREGPPFRFDPERRSLVRAELDAAFFHLYGICRDDLAYVLDTFPIVRRQDTTEHGYFRTKELILDVYDRMTGAIETGENYQTILDPPPADSSLCHPIQRERPKDD